MARTNAPAAAMTSHATASWGMSPVLANAAFSVAFDALDVPEALDALDVPEAPEVLDVLDVPEALVLPFFPLVLLLFFPPPSLPPAFLSPPEFLPLLLLPSLPLFLSSFFGSGDGLSFATVLKVLRRHFRHRRRLAACGRRARASPGMSASARRLRCPF